MVQALHKEGRIQDIVTKAVKQGVNTSGFCYEIYILFG